MKKLTMLLMATLFIFGLAACGGDDNGDDNGNDNGDNGNDVVLDQALEAAFEGIGTDRPVYLTTIGQTEDVDILWNVFGQVFDNTDERNETVTRDSLLVAADVEAGALVLIAPGASSKGMGAAGVDQASEIARANAFTARAANEEITVILIHSGGMQRRGTLSDPMIEAVASEAALMLVLNSGNDDLFFNGLHDTLGAPLYLFSNNPSLVDPLKQLFDK